ncbi:MAG: nitrogenase cofactor biosynthesis protein NifB [Candidatus Electrothrix aestuarii]|uniref:FeMo cofactor biosynthesis protein NifB n=1 Tax=Candidatus Electrothrix aestuarii TaxID=3062594 RepID=A0AAU8LSA5_9BACT|nr:nitrogenase cofactor biosynthesis protein NifB [Candidatus Electrothrix aestuarii]
MNDKDFNRHPCFNAKVKGQYGRVHLPVAPKCNIQCNFCNRKFDCVNESRPGVTSTILTPEQALEYMGKVLEKEPRISVAGIAGPGDPFANAEETLETMRLIRNNFPDTILCLASNGMNLAPHVEELAEIGVSHVTVTVNGVDPAVTENVYSWVRDGKVLYRGRQGAELLLARQLSAIEKLKKHDITVKINSILIPGVNDHHIIDIAKKMKDMGADLFNCMAMLPNADTVFENLTEPSKEVMKETRNEAEKYLPQMRHCTRCRADAVGLLDNDRTDEMRGCLSACASLPKHSEVVRPYVAVATQEGVLVNQHLGEATRFQIWGKNEEEGGYKLIEERQAPSAGGGSQRWLNISRILSDCQAILVSDLGDGPKEALSKRGLKPITMSGFIEKGLEAIYTGKGLSSLQGRMRKCSSKGACLGTGTGCG